jgi:hypothetical protein
MILCLEEFASELSPEPSFRRLSAECTAIFRLSADVPTWWLAGPITAPPPLAAVPRKAATADLL